MPRKNKGEFNKIQKALSGMKVGQLKHVRVGPGRSGLVTVKKGNPMSENIKLLQGMPRRKSKVIRAKGY